MRLFAARLIIPILDIQRVINRALANIIPFVCPLLEKSPRSKHASAIKTKVSVCNGAVIRLWPSALNFP